MQVWPAVLGRFVCGVAVVLAAAGCSPEYNWREIPVADGRARAAFPARVQTQQRPVALDGREVAFTLTTATVRGAVFAVGYASLPDDARTGQARARLAQALVRSLYRNVGSEPPASLPPPGEEIEIAAQLDGEPVLLLARLIVQDGALIEAVAMGPSRNLPRERAQEFVRSLQPLR